MTRCMWVLDRTAEGLLFTMACKIVEVSCRAFNDWRRKRAGGPTDAELEEAVLVVEMREIHVESDATYGQRR